MTMADPWRTFWDAFLTGLYGSPAVRNPCTGRTDAEALRGDWQKVGGDLRKAMEKVENDG